MTMVSSQESTSRVQHMTCAICPHARGICQVQCPAEKEGGLVPGSLCLVHISPLCLTKPQHSNNYSPFCTHKVIVWLHIAGTLVDQDFISFYICCTLFSIAIFHCLQVKCKHAPLILTLNLNGTIILTGIFIFQNN